MEITINGKAYRVVEATYADVTEHKAVAAEMKKHGITAQFCVSRPKGRKMFLVNQYESGAFSTLTCI